MKYVMLVLTALTLMVTGACVHGGNMPYAGAFALLAGFTFILSKTT